MCVCVCVCAESHPDYLAELKVIEKVRQRRLGEAERNKSMQIKNIHALYAFEVENIEAGVKVSCWVFAH